MTGLLRASKVPDDYAKMLLRDMDAARHGSYARVSHDVEQIIGRPPVTFAQYAAQAAPAWTTAARPGRPE
jgi:hypothetical protein